MAYRDIIYENRYLDGVARITLNRPEKLNAFSARLLDEFFTALAEAEDDDELKVVIIRGAGRCFASGYDLNPPPLEASEESSAEPDGRGLSWSFFRKGSRRRTGTAEDLRYLYFRATKWLSLWDYRKITIAQVHNYCLSGANELAGTCDLIIASEDAVFGHPAARSQGNLPNSFGALWAINMGLRQAKWLALTGKTMTAAEALRVGYVNKVVPREKLEEETNEAARSVALMEMDFLTLHKRAINRFFEVAGLKTCINTGVEFDALVHASEASQRLGAEFNKIKQEQGLKAALTWRDARYADGRTAGRGVQAQEKKK
ncbi:MAG: enoyl-CoA hydratase/isomerase family protein [Chloroflexi bacterium]|nr:enoyl-CoA hydratase/isomerase family protein [Chloroflexota bacterium]